MSIISRRAFLGRTAVTPAVKLLVQSEVPPQEKRAMSELARAFMENYAAPGLSVAIAKDGKFVYAEAFGLADETRRIMLTTRHRFRIASVSKPVTSVAIMGLIEKGTLQLSDRVFGKDAILGVEFGAKPYGALLEAITLEHLLTHTAGGWSNSGPEPDPMFINPRMNHAQLISWTLDNIPIHNVPGEHWAYSNFGYCVLGRVIEKLAGVTYAEYVAGKVMKPCGIRSMEIAGNTLEDRRQLEVVYSGQGGEDPYGMQVARLDAHGGWIATASDLVQFALHVDGFPTVPDILKRETVQTMITPSAASAAYAKGWMVNRENNWWHNGSLPGTESIMVRTGGGMCWAALINTRRPRSKIGLDLDRLIWGMVGKVAAWTRT